MTDLYSSRFYDLLPPNLRSPHTAALSHAFDRQMRELAAYIPIVYMMAMVDCMNETMCDQVALNFNISEYRLDMDLDTKREMIRFAFQISARKGTAWAVNRLVATIFGSAETEEWVDYDGDPYFFRIWTNNMLAGPDDYRDFLSAIFETKNVRSWLEAIILELRSSANVYVGPVFHDISKETNDLIPYAGDISPPPMAAYVGMAYHEVTVESHNMEGGVA